MLRPGRDCWIGLAIMLLAAIYWLEADKIRISPLDGPVNASGLPKSLAYALGGLALVLVARSLIETFIGLGKTSGEPARISIQELARPHLRALGMLAIGVGYLLIVSWLGYIGAIIALMFTVAVYNGAAVSRKSVLVAGCGGIVYHLLFVEFLGIPLPPGLLEPLLG